MGKTIRTYSELIRLPTFLERFRYLSLKGVVAQETFGFDRYLNQAFYASKEWKQIRNQIILRDNGCDLGVDGYPICGKAIIHHLNPVTVDDIVKQSEFLLNPEYLICTTRLYPLREAKTILVRGRGEHYLDSILISIKKLLGITEDYEHFDPDIIMHINSVFSILTQLGVGSADGFSITGAGETWSDYIQDEKKLEMVKSYIYQKVRLLFDPPTSSALMEAANNAVAELEWRLNAAVENVESGE